MDWQAVTLPHVSTPAGLLSATLLFAASFLALWGLALLALRKASSGSVGIFGVKPGTWALKIMMLFHHSIAAPLALLAVWEDEAAAQLFRCFGCWDAANLALRNPAGRSSSALAIIPFTMGYMVADLVLISQWQLAGKTRSSEDFLMILHHIFSLIVWPLAVILDYCTTYVLFLVSFEVSSIFLVLNWMLSTCGKKSSPMYALSGLLFTASFVFVRLLGALPQLRAMATKQPWLCYSEYPDGGPILIWASLALVLPHILNAFWGVKVIRGFIAIATKRTARGSGKAPLLEKGNS